MLRDPVVFIGPLVHVLTLEEVVRLGADATRIQIVLEQPGGQTGGEKDVKVGLAFAWGHPVELRMGEYHPAHTILKQAQAALRAQAPERVGSAAAGWGAGGRCGDPGSMAIRTGGSASGGGTITCEAPRSSYPGSPC